jgi:HD-GYP domain-containing protein (c-di-GMP phosphodiesterase class II)
VPSLAAPHALAVVSHAALSSTDHADVLEPTVALTRETLGVDFAAVLHAPPGGDHLSVVAGAGFTPRLVVALRDALPISSWAGEAPLASTPLLRAHGARSSAAMPIRTAERRWGALLVADRSPRTYTQEELAFLDSVAHVLGLGIQHAADAARLRLGHETLQHAWRETLVRILRAVEFRDDDTGAHLTRMSEIAAILGEELGLSLPRCDDLRLAATLHDAGKVAIPDTILHKPGPLADDERRVMETHALVGHQLLTGSGNELLELAAAIALHHHERWDGAGYPHGIAGAAIPLEARIAAVADVFDALTSDRPYRPALALDEALAIMHAGRGTQFDPEIVDALGRALPRIPGVAVP